MTSIVTAYLQSLLAFVALHPTLAIVTAFIMAFSEGLLIVGLFVPSTVVLVGIGSLAGLGRLPFWPAFIATILGAAAGDQLSYWIGRVCKGWLAEIWPFSRYRGLLKTGQQYFALHGGKSIVIGRFVPGIKAVVPGVAGMMGMGVIPFAVLNVLSAVAWAAVHLLPGLWAGLALTGLSAASKRLAIVIGAFVIGIVLLVWLAKPAIRLCARYLPRLHATWKDWARGRHNPGRWALPGWTFAMLLVLVALAGPPLTGQSIPALMELRHDILMIDWEFERLSTRTNTAETRTLGQDDLGRVESAQAKTQVRGGVL
jgi:membrane protein DedA with SNARE-associated domain